MKKMAFFAAAVMALSAFSFHAFAEEITSPGSKELTLSATKGVAYTLVDPFRDEKRGHYHHYRPEDR